MRRVSRGVKGPLCMFECAETGQRPKVWDGTHAEAAADMGAFDFLYMRGMYIFSRSDRLYYRSLLVTTSGFFGLWGPLPAYIS